LSIQERLPRPSEVTSLGRCRCAGAGRCCACSAARALRLAASPYVWRVRARLADRFGARCRVLVRGARNSCLVEFASDGYRVVTSRNYLRKAPPGGRWGPDHARPTLWGIEERKDDDHSSEDEPVLD